MAFKDRLRDMRVQAGITQKGLASAVGITERSIQNYELGTRKPNNMEVVQKIADALHTTTEYLLGSEETFVIEAHEKGGAKSARDVNDRPVCRRNFGRERQRRRHGSHQPCLLGCEGEKQKIHPEEVLQIKVRFIVQSIVYHTSW